MSDSNYYEYMKVLSAFINSLLSFFIVLSGTSFVVNKVADAEYLNKTAKESGVYKGVSEVVSRRLIETSANNLGVPPEQIPAQVSDVVSEEYITAKSEEVTTQIEQALRGEREKITIDISDLASQARAAGLSVNPSDLKPIEINAPQTQNESSSTRTAQSLDFIRFISYILTAVLFIASIALSIIRKSLKGFALALISSGLMFAVFALVGTLVSNTIVGWVALPETITEITPYAQTFARSLLDEVSSLYGWFAISLTLFGVILFFVNKTLQKKFQASSRATTHPSAQTPQFSQTTKEDIIKNERI